MDVVGDANTSAIRDGPVRSLEVQMLVDHGLGADGSPDGVVGCDPLPIESTEAPPSDVLRWFVRTSTRKDERRAVL